MAEKTGTINEGEKAPDFRGTTADGCPLELGYLRGKWVVLYFYPRDNTPGCTRQACAFRDATDEFASLNAVVVGCSPDSATSHGKFVERFGLPFALLTDEDHAIATLYGVWKEKSLYGKKYMGIERTTFLIDPDGTVNRIWWRVKVDKHIDAVLEHVRTQSAGAGA